MTSSGSSVNDALAGYVAGRMTAAQLASVVAVAYYGKGGHGKRDELRAIIEIIEKAHPGVVELSASADKPGFAVRLAERPFPKSYEAALRQVVEGMVITPVPRQSFLARILQAVRRVFRVS